MRYDILLFDADDTLFDFTRSERAAITDVLNKSGIPATESTIGLYSKINIALWKKLEKGEITKGELTVRRFEQLLETMGLQGDAAEMNRRYLSKLRECSFLKDGAEELCKALYGKCRLFIITNGLTDVQKNRLKLSGLDKYIEKAFISEEIGFQKPQTGFFDCVFDYLGDVDKGRILVIGDSVTSDIAGGINSGLDTCLIDPQNNYPEFKKCNYKIKNLSEIILILSQTA